MEQTPDYNNIPGQILIGNKDSNPVSAHVQDEIEQMAHHLFVSHPPQVIERLVQIHRDSLNTNEIVEMIQKMEDLFLVKGLDEFEGKTNDRESSPEILQSPPILVPEPCNNSLKPEVIRFIERYSLDLPSSLRVLAKRVFNSEPSLAGFVYEDFIAACISFRCIENKGKKGLSEKFALHEFIKKYADPGALYIYRTFVNESEPLLLEKYPGIIDIPTKNAFVDYCKLRVPGVAKPAGGTESVGPDLCVWLNERTLLAVGSKISKQAFKHVDSEKPRRELMVSRGEILDNVFSLDIDHFGMSRENFKKNKPESNAFSERVKEALFLNNAGFNLYIQVNSFLPFSKSNKKVEMGQDYSDAINNTVKVDVKKVTVNSKEYIYSVIKVNLFNDNYLESGLISGDEKAVEYIKKLFFDPLERLTGKIKSTG